MNNLFSTLVSFLILANLTTLFGQSPGYLHYSMKDGLPSNRTYCAVQDREGYLWFGTDKGLVRFDGQNFKNYGIADGIPDPEVLNLFEDPKGRLWLGCFRQEPTFRWQGQFYTKAVNQLLDKVPTGNNLSQFVSGRDSSLLAGNGMLLHFKGLVPPNLQISSQKAGIRLFAKIGDEVFGITKRAIRKIQFLGDSLRMETVYTFEKKLYPTRIAVNGNRLLISGLYSILLDYSEGQFSCVFQKPEVYFNLFVDQQHRFWSCSPEKGAICFDNNQRELSNPEVYLPGKKVSSFYQDFQGNYWFHTIGEGLYCLPQKNALNWQKKDGLRSDFITALAKGVNGRLFVGDEIGNVYQVYQNNLRLLHAFGSRDGHNAIRQVIPLNREDFYTVTDEGVYLFEGKTKTQLAENALYGAFKCMVEVDEHLYLGTSSGLYQLRPDQSIFKSIRIGRVTVLKKDCENNLWMGNTAGVFSAKDSFSTNWGDHFSDLKKRIVGIEPGAEPGIIWFVTAGADLIKAKTHNGVILSVESIVLDVNPRVNGINAITMGPNNHIWLGTNRGVLSIDTLGTISSFTQKNGLLSNDILKLCFMEDTLWIGSVHGLSKLVPEDELLLNEGIHTQITNFSYYLKGSLHSLDFSGKHHLPVMIQLPPAASPLEAEFAALKGHPGETLRFRHALNQKVLPFPYYTFSNFFKYLTHPKESLLQNSSVWNFGLGLAPGNYSIQSAALLYNNTPYAQSAYWSLIVLPRWYETIWPQLFILLNLILLIWYFNRVNRKNLTLEIESAEAKLSALRTQINPHFVGNSINAIQQFFYPPEPEKASEYIHLFTVLLRQTLELSEKDFVSIQQELEYVKAYLEMIKLRYGDRFAYTIDKAPNIDDRVLFPTMFLQPILENATIHGLSLKGPSCVQVFLSRKGDYINCVITDNGIGIKASLKKKGSNHLVSNNQPMGMEILKRKVKMLNRLHQLDMRIQWQDLATADEGSSHGTKVILTYLRYDVKH